jgi:hypothetical protein
MTGSVCGRMELCPIEDAWRIKKELNPELLALVDKLGV